MGITGISLRWFESYLTGRSFRVAWGGEESKAHLLVTGVPQGWVLGPLLFCTYTTSLAPIIQAHGFSYHFYADDTQLYLSFQPDDPTVVARISGCWQTSRHERTSPTAQPGKDWASCLLYHSNSTAWFHHPAKFFYNYPIKFSQKYLCDFRWPADFQRPHCKDCSILQVCTSQHQKDLALPYTACCTTSCPGPCHFQAGLLQCSSSWIPSCTIKPLQMIQNAAARLVFSKPKRAHVTSLFISLHWLLVAACIKFKMLMLAFRTATGSAPSYFHSLMTIYISSRSLRSASARRLVVPEAQNHSPEHFNSLFLAGGMNFPPSSGMLSPWQFSSDTWKLISSVITWLHLKK